MNKVELKTKDQTTMTCYFSEPKTKVQAGVIILQEAFGVNAHIQELTLKFAKEGYLAIAPELYHRTAESGWTCDYNNFKAAENHFSAINENGIIEDVGACYDWIHERYQIQEIASIGYCMGGRASFIANSSVPLKAAISYYGGRIVPNYLSLASSQRAPLLFFWGGQDTGIPQEQIRSLTEALTASKKTYTNIVISDAGHGFSTDDRASFHPLASQLAWATSLEFLKINLVTKN